MKDFSIETLDEYKVSEIEDEATKIMNEIFGRAAPTNGLVEKNGEKDDCVEHIE